MAGYRLSLRQSLLATAILAFWFAAVSARVAAESIGAWIVTLIVLPALAARTLGSQLVDRDRRGRCRRDDDDSTTMTA